MTPATYCSDVMKTNNSFIIHVNADKPELVDYAYQLAVEYRCQFNRDVIIDINGYRRLGHNEHDSPKFTQPKVYSKVDNHPKLSKLYGAELVKEGVLTQQEVDAMYRKHFERLSQAYENSKKSYTTEVEREPLLWKPYLGKWNNCPNPAGPPTSISDQSFVSVGTKINQLPTGVDLHPLAVKTYEARLKSIETGVGLDWGTAEALALGTLLDQGYGVRISGEDVKRGTFSHRHAVLFDQTTNHQYAPLNNVGGKKGTAYKFSAHNSLLSEYAVMGFDYGYSITNPDVLTIWEAQFGDFSNCAQPIIDLYLANGEVKWGLKSGMVLLLPHGLDGQGPEHSSSRVERYLQMLDDDSSDPRFTTNDDLQLRLSNYTICNVTEPANYFHLLRRQLLRDYRKPLVVLTPKRLLRLKEAKNDKKDFTQIDRFRPVLGDGAPQDTVAPKDAKTLYICTGQLYYELIERRKTTGRKDIGIIRLEQIAPFPYNEMERHLKNYPNAKIVFMQEEPANQAYWGYVKERLEVVTKRMNRPAATLLSRKVAAASAPGSTATHKKQQEELLQRAFSI
jgi:2-oxoglutarate dehydrogenase E1 component